MAKRKRLSSPRNQKPVAVQFTEAAIEVSRLRGTVASLRAQLDQRDGALRRENASLKEITIRQTMQLVELHNELLDFRAGNAVSAAQRQKEVAEELLRCERDFTVRLHGDRDALIAAVIRLSEQPTMSKLGRVNAGTALSGEETATFPDAKKNK